MGCGGVDVGEVVASRDISVKLARIEVARGIPIIWKASSASNISE